MHAVLFVLLPIFALILAGYVAGWQRWLGPAATDSLNRFVVRLALPAELFGSITQANRAQIDHPGFLFAYAGGMLLTFAIGFGLDYRRPAVRTHRIGAAAVDGLSAAYANTAFIGIPLCLGVFGPAGLPPVVLASLLTVCVLFALAIALVELDLQAGQAPGRVLLKVGKALLRNPLVAAPIAAGVVNACGIPLGGPVLRFTDLLGGAASPCALVTIGLFLFDTAGRSASLRAVGGVVGAKLLLQPALTAVIAMALRLDPLWMQSAILISALPVGTGPFMLARLYDREADVASRATLISTVLSLATVSLLLGMMTPPR